MTEAQMTEARTSASRMNEAVKTATSKMPVCQPEARLRRDQMTRGQMRLNSNPHGLRKADWSDIAFSEWWLCRDYLCEGRD